MKSIILTGALLPVAFAGIAYGADIDGQWSRGDGNAEVEISPCGSDICAVNTWIKPGTPKENKGDKLVMTIKPGGDGVYAGSAFDPQRNLTYSITLTIKGDKMTTRGCIVAGLLCKGVDWTRMH